MYSCQPSSRTAALGSLEGKRQVVRSWSEANLRPWDVRVLDSAGLTRVCLRRDVQDGSLHAGAKSFTLLDLCVSSLRRGHANILCIVPILTDDPLRESVQDGYIYIYIYILLVYIYIYIYIYTHIYIYVFIYVLFPGVSGDSGLPSARISLYSGGTTGEPEIITLSIPTTIISVRSRKWHGWCLLLGGTTWLTLLV